MKKVINPYFCLRPKIQWYILTEYQFLQDFLIHRPNYSAILYLQCLSDIVTTSGHGQNIVAGR